MITRRQFALSMPWLAAGPLAFSACSPQPSADDYEAVAERTWMPAAMTDRSGAAQLADAAFVEELNSWIRFDGAAAVRSRDGLYSICTGNPNIPSWIGDLAFRWLLTAKGENDELAR